MPLNKNCLDLAYAADDPCQLRKTFAAILLCLVYTEGRAARFPPASPTTMHLLSLASPRSKPQPKTSAQPLLYLLLGSELVGVPALLLAAVGGSRGQTGVALSADHLLTVVLGGEGLERGLDDTASETEDEMEGRFLSTQNRQTWFGFKGRAWCTELPRKRSARADSLPFGCCSRSESGHPRVACRRKSVFAGPVGCLPCPGSWT